LPPEVTRTRLAFLCNLLDKEVALANATARRLFVEGWEDRVHTALQTDVAFGEQIEAFAARFGRLQDTLGDKMLPTLLEAVDEPVRAQIDNLDRAEKFGWLVSVERWREMRRVRNWLVHEYLDQPDQLVCALKMACDMLPELAATAMAMVGEVRRRGWVEAPGT
jgi:hypothetical protein